ncbi:hypothetical protein MICAE_1520015 [Microcystis aeruginosa PCC 9806]|uniref:Uncharacterized protein n=2 Tax=Microcystis TaxID=1125 RepID=A0A552LPW3_9CHRO|nr:MULTISPECIES: hypothetical protein [Microcystis]NCR75675.1 hypothetical protein [Microcystis aeruginosa K13-06]TRV22250.1 MAG: hypothetical protein EWV40_10565 [Microcystis flos-aquae Mf_WU_F_19750830_S460]MCA2666688.1 hypothetical protein [Microcystis sp. M045S2]MCA2712618.1 hypothetical protein [Microcystis sp. M172S2]MCA2803972.1 hypothetical protein [Microcystis sp. M114S2]
MFGFEELFLGGAETFLGLGGLLDFLGSVVSITDGIMAFNKMTKQQEIKEKVIPAKITERGRGNCSI